MKATIHNFLCGMISAAASVMPHLPFVMMSQHTETGEEKAIIAWREIITAVCIAGVMAVGSSVMTTSSIKAELGFFKKDLARVEETTTKSVNDLREDIKEIDRRVYQHQLNTERYGQSERSRRGSN